MLSCKKKEKWQDVDPAFAKYVEAYTTGIVSKTTSIRVQLAADATTTHTVGQAVKEDLFSIKPSAKGRATWIDARTIEFKPETNLQPDQVYEVNFKLGKVTRVPEKFNDFRFSLQTIRPACKLEQTGLRSTNEKDKMFLNGEITTADSEEATGIEKILSVSQGSVSWQHSNNNKTHSFSITGIRREAKETKLSVKWDGNKMKMNGAGEEWLAIPAAGDFKVLNIMPVNDAQQYASVQFSNPIAVGQDLTGLLTVSNLQDVAYTISGSEVKLYMDGMLEGNYSVNVNPGIKDAWGNNLESSYSGNIVFENRLPSVRIHGKGNILPSSGKLVLPFEAVNLSAVDISIIKIYENNVPQFLQDNDLGGNYELRRVSKPVVQKTLRLDNDKTLDLHRKQRFSLDIDKFLKTEPGAIYRVTIGFRPEYSLYSKMAMDTTAEEDNSEESYYEDEYDGYASNSKDDDGEF